MKPETQTQIAQVLLDAKRFDLLLSFLSSVEVKHSNGEPNYRYDDDADRRIFSEWSTLRASGTRRYKDGLRIAKRKPDVYPTIATLSNAGDIGAACKRVRFRESSR